MRPLTMVGGLAVLALAWGVVPRSELLPFTAHMLTHTALVAIAAPLLALGLAGGRLDPVPRAPAAFGALALSLVELVVVWAWHTPALHRAAHHASALYWLEQTTFLVSGLALWAAALGGGAELRRTRAVEGVAGLLFTSMHMTLLGALVGLAPRPLYDHGTVVDQQVGGAVMLLVGGGAYLAGALGLIADLLRRPSS